MQWFLLPRFFQSAYKSRNWNHGGHSRSRCIHCISQRWKNRRHDRPSEDHTVRLNGLLCGRSFPDVRKRHADDDIGKNHRWSGRGGFVNNRACLSVRDIPSPQQREACLHRIHRKYKRLCCQRVGGLFL